MTPGKTRGLLDFIYLEPRRGDTKYAKYRPPRRTLTTTTFHIPPALPGVIDVKIPQYCGTGSFGSTILISM